ncbi:MAG: ABC transporter permease [Candidatus Natronoplasma sp.]
MKNHIDDLFTLYSLMTTTVKKAILNRRFLMVILVMLFISGLMGYTATQEPKGLDEGSDLLDIFVISFFLPLMAMVFGSSLLKDEIEDKSITHVLIAPLSRAKMYIGYYASLVIVSTFAVLLILSSGFFSYFSIAGLDSSALELYLKMTGLVMLGTIVYSSLFLLVSVLIDKALYFGLFYVFIWEGFVGSLPGNIKLVSIRHYLRSLGEKYLEHGSIASYGAASSSGRSVLVLGILIFLLMVIGILLFREKEFP